MPELSPGPPWRPLATRFAWLAVAIAIAGGIRPLAAQPMASPEFRGAVPSSPAFVLVGGTSEKVMRPATTRDLGIALLGGIGGDGGIRPGIALEASPWTYLGVSIPLDEYRSSPVRRALANLQLSMATVSAGEDSASTDVAVGLRIPLYDDGDPMADSTFIAELGTLLLACLPGDENPDVEEADVQACTDRATASAFEAYTGSHWNATRLSLAIAVGGRVNRTAAGGTDAENRDDYSGLQAWLSSSLPIGTRGALLSQIDFADRASFVTDSLERSVSGGARLVVGTAAANVFLEASGTRGWLGDGATDTSGGWSAGIELRFASDLWITTGVGRTFDRLGAPDRTVVLANLRWGVASASRIAGLARGSLEQARTSGP